MSRLPVRVMIVEDSAVVRQLLLHIIAQDPRLTVVAAVASAEEALAEVPRVRPDVISMDIRLPGIDGLEATRQLMARYPTPIVVIADAVGEATLKISMNALKAGALSVVEKPTGLDSGSYGAVADTIRTQLRIMSEVPVIRRREISAASERAPRGQAGDLRGLAKPSVMGIAASTGGPPALAKVLGSLPATFPVPIMVVQHMGAAFMDGFAAWLDGQTPLAVRIGRADEKALPGSVYVAPGDRHMELGPSGTLRLPDYDPILGQRPSADIMFQSIARRAGPTGLGILLTGMGEDGARGLLALRHAGGFTIAEDESSCVVYGMPAAANRLGAVKLSLRHDEIAGALMRLVEPVQGRHG